MRQGYHLLPIAMTPELQRTYRSAVIGAQEFAGFSNTANVDTVAVSTLLAVFNWTPLHGRYADVTNFMAAFFMNLKGLREQTSNSIWRQADIAAQSPGWTRFPAVQPNQVLKPAQLAELALIEPPPAMLAPEGEPNPAPTQKAKHIRVLAVGRAPLADQHLPDGGLITALLGSCKVRAQSISHCHGRAQIVSSPTISSTPRRCCATTSSIPIRFCNS